MTLCFAEDVDSDAGVVGVLLLLYGYDTQNGIGVLVVESKVRDSIVL